MSTYIVKVQPSGLLNDHAWPRVGETVDLPADVGDGMVKAGHLEKKAAAKTAASKPEDKVETRPAPTEHVEKRPVGRPRKSST